MIANTNKAKIFFFRNGISIALLFLLIVVGVVLFAIKMNKSSEIELIKLGKECGYIGLILTETEETKALNVDSVFFFNLNGDNFSFSIDSIKHDNSFRILYMTPIPSEHNKLPLSSKIIYRKRSVRLWDCLFHY